MAGDRTVRTVWAIQQSCFAHPYRAIPKATETFNDPFAPYVGIDNLPIEASARVKASGLTPSSSDPMIMVAFCGKVKFPSSVPPVSSAKKGPSRFSREHRCQDNISVHPMALRLARGWSGSAQKGESHSFSAPNDSAVRKMDPTL